jgi:ADP-ribose pyrophosphatase YjhB (NUDIX family)
LEHRFNLRVYALIIDENKRILLSDEYRFGHFFTKFPGGGVEANEGILTALKRELQEELSAEVLSSSFFYFNDFEQISAFDSTQSLVAFYYLVQVKEPEKIGTNVYPTPFSEETEKQRWVNIYDVNADDLTFPIDQLVLGKVKEMLIS